jgi:ABC-type phosphate transport system substrate-binding protein
MKRAKRTLVILSLALANCRGPMHTPTATPEIVSIRMMATSSTYPLLHDLASAYAAPGKLLTGTYTAASWDLIQHQIEADEIPYALTTYLPMTSTLWAAPIGQSGIAIITHPANTTPYLTLDQLRRIMQGRLLSWEDVGGPKLPITVISREDSSDIRRSFDQLVMDNRRTTLNAHLELSDQSVIDAVASTPGAIGYISMGALTGTIHVLPLTTSADLLPQLPLPESVAAGLYPLTVPLLIVGKTPPAPGSFYYEWFAWMQSGAGQTIIRQKYAPLSAEAS